MELAVSADAFFEIKKSKRPDGSFDPSLVSTKIQEAGHSKELANLVIYMLTVNPAERPSPLQAYEHAAFVGMETLFESHLKDWAWIPTVLQQATEIASLEGRIVQIHSDHDEQLSEVAGRATAAEAALATAQAALAAAAEEEPNENDPHAAAPDVAAPADAAADPNAAAAAGDDAEEVDGANPGGLNAMQKYVTMVGYNHESSVNPNSLPNARFLAVADALHGLVTFDQVREFITQGGTRAVFPHIWTEAQIMTFGTNRGRTECARANIPRGGSKEKSQEKLIEFFRVYWP